MGPFLLGDVILKKWNRYTKLFIKINGINKIAIRNEMNKLNVMNDIN